MCSQNDCSLKVQRHVTLTYHLSTDYNAHGWNLLFMFLKMLRIGRICL